MSTASERSSRRDESGPVPWWRVGMVWFMLSGPAIVVVAALATMSIAYHGAETVVSDAPSTVAAPTPRATAPALQARNHAATPAP
jgi:hypothetical protein